MDMTRRSQRKPRTTGSSLGFDGSHQFGYPLWDSIANDKLWERRQNGKCLGCGKEPCRCKRKGSPLSVLAVLLLCALLLIPSRPAHGEGESQFFSVARDAAGTAIAQATVGVYAAGTSTLVPIYSDLAGTAPKGNPFLSDLQGNYSFFAPPRLYKIVVTKVGTGTFTTDNVPVGTQPHAERHVAAGPDPVFLQALGGLLLPGQITPGSLTSTQVSPTAAIPESKLSLNFPTHSNASDPSAGQKAALVGTVGLPSNTNRYVTDQDGRNTNARTPVSHAASHGAAGTDPVSIAPSQLSAPIAGTPAAAGLATTNHHLTHQLAGSDQLDVSGLPGVLASPQLVAVKGDGTAAGSRPTINFIDGTNTTVAVTDNPGANRIDVQVNTPELRTVALASGSTTISNPLAVLSFSISQFSLLESPTGTGLVSLVPSGITLTGDVTGSLASTTVGALQGRPVAITAPTSGDRLVWNGSQWAPAPLASLAVQQAGSNVVTNPTAINFASGFSVSAAGSQANVSLNLAGQTINATQLQGVPIISTTPTDQQVLRYISADGTWEPTSPLPSFGTYSTPSGTNPTPTVSGDTLTYLATAPVSITGSSGAKSITFAVGDATTSTKGVLKLGGDLAGGSATSPSVTGLQTVPVATTAPTIGQVLKYDGATWSPGTDNTGGGGVTLVTAGNGVTVVSNTSTLNFGTGLDVTQSPTGQGNIALNLSELANVSATQLQGRNVATTAPTDGQLLKWVSADSKWEPSAPPATGVTSVGLSVPGVLFSVSGSPVTSTGTLALSLLTQSAHCVVAGPTSGSAATPTCRSLVATDLPTVPLSQTSGNYVASVATGTGLTGGSGGSAGAVLTLSATNATNAALGVVELNTDLGGSATAPNVVGLQGRAVTSTAPTSGQVLAWNGSSWAPATPTVSLSARTQTKSFTILTPNDSSGNDVGYLYMPVGATITQVASRVRGSTSCDSNVKINNSAVLSSNLTGTTSGAQTTTISTPTINTGDWLSFYVGACIGSPLDLTITVVYVVG